MRIYVVPVNGARVPYIDAAGRRALLPDEGASVVDSGFWQRRLNDGDVVISAPPTVSRKRAEKE
jgi:hypothetical protein